MQSQDAHFCRLESAPQKIALSGRVLLLSSGLTTLMYTSCPKYQVSRFCTRKFHMPALSRNTRIAVQAPGNTCNQVDSVKLFIDYRGLLYRKPRFIVTPKHRKKSLRQNNHMQLPKSNLMVYHQNLHHVTFCKLIRSHVTEAD